jgi:hypothetical protein
MKDRNMDLQLAYRPALVTGGDGRDATHWDC